MKRKILAMLLAMAMLLSLSAAHAKGEALEMSDVPGMTAPGIFPLVTEPVQLPAVHVKHAVLVAERVQ